MKSSSISPGFRTLFVGLLVVCCLYALTTPPLYFLSGKAISPLTIHINGISPDVSSVQFVSLLNNKFVKPNNHCENTHATGFEIKISEENFEHLKSVEVQNGKDICVVDKQDLHSKFIRDSNESDTFILKSSSIITPAGSIVPILNGCITWEGDVAFILNAWKTYLPLFFVALCIFALWLICVFGSWNFSKWIDHHSIKLLLFTCVGMLLISFFYVKRIYHTNDDLTIIAAIRSGDFVICMSNILGGALSILYRHVYGNIEWYGWMLYCANLISLLIVLFSIFKYFKNRLICLTVSLIASGMFLYSFTEIAFTISAILLCGASLFAITCSLLRGTPRRLQVIGLGLLLALGYLIRMKSIMAVIVFLCPISFYLLLRYGRLKNFIVWRRGLLFLIPLLVVIILEKGVIPQFHSKEHKKFVQFANACIPSINYGAYNKKYGNKGILYKNHWSENDFTMLYSHVFCDEDKYSLEKINNINELVSVVPLVTSIPSMKRIFNVIRETIKIRWLPRWVFFTPCLLLLLLAFQPLKVIELLGIILLFFVFSFLMCLWVKLPARVYYPAALISSLFGYLIILDRSNFNPSRQKAVSILTIGICFFLFCLTQVTRHKDEIAEKKELFSQKISAVKEVCGKGTLVAYPLWFLLEDQDPLFFSKENAEIIDKVHFIGGWDIFSPTFYKKLKLIGLNSGHELLINLYKNPNFYYLGGEYDPELLLVYLQDNFDPNVEIIKRREVSPKRFIIQYSTSDDN